MILQILKEWSIIIGIILGTVVGFAALMLGGLKIQDWIDDLEDKYQHLAIIGIFLVVTLGLAIFMALNHVK